MMMKRNYIAFTKTPDNVFIVVASWMRNHSTIFLLGLWEQTYYNIGRYGIMLLRAKKFAGEEMR